MTPEEIKGKFEKLVSELLDLLAIDAVVTIGTVEGEERNYLNIDLEVEQNPAELIGKYGSTLDSFTTVLVGMMSTIVTDGSWGVIVDVNNYRQERGKYIEDLTEKAIAQVEGSSQAVVLNPMKPWERRLVHMVSAKNPDISTRSEGDGMERHVIIEPA